MTSASSQATVRPGALTALLGELARAPAASGWRVPARPGERIGRFEILREIGRGGFGVVYEARDTELGRSVAFKAIHAGAAEATQELRLLAEAEAAARLAHPNIVHLYDVGRCERGAFLIMELLRGETLDDRLARGPLHLRHAVHLATEIARGLAHAHERGVVHRDLKPGNVFLCDDGQVKVLDFGLARVFGQAGTSGGTPAYMAPEQARGDPSDERADVYALGVIVHELVTGRRPFDGEREGGVPDGGRPADLPRAPAALARLVSRMLARDPAARPVSAVPAQAQLAAIRKSLEPNRLLIASAVIAATTIVAAGAFAYFWQRPLPPGRLLVAMADTANATGDPDLDAAGSFLGTAMEESARIALVARSRLVNILSRKGSPPHGIDEGAARAAAHDAGAQVLLVPAVRRVGDDYEVAVHAIRMDRGEPLFAARERAGAKGSVADALDRLSARVLRELREDPSDATRARVKVAQFAPARPEAWRHFGEWERLASEGRGKEARAAFERGLAADPEYPLAHVQLMLVAAQGDAADVEKAGRHAEIARANLHRIPAKERTLVEAMTGVFFGGTQAERLRLLDEAIANWPEDPRAHVWAGNILLHQYGDARAARPYLEKALAIAPLPPDQAQSFLVALGRMDEALAVARRLGDERPSVRSYAWLSAVHRWRGESAEALEAVRRMISLAPNHLPGQRVDLGPGPRFAYLQADALAELNSVLGPPEDRSPHWLALRGRWREALAALDAAAPPTDAPAAAKAWFHWERGALLAHSTGDADAVWREIEEQFRYGFDLLGCNIGRLALLGDLERARRLGESVHLEAGDACYRDFRLVEAWMRGDREAALRGFVDMISAAGAFHRGEILAELGRHRDAVEAFRAYRRVPDFPWGELFYEQFRNAAYYPRSMVLEAAALERLGERDEARRLLDRLLRIWDRADPDAPMLREAKALRVRLAKEAAP